MPDVASQPLAQMVANRTFRWHRGSVSLIVKASQIALPAEATISGSAASGYTAALAIGV